MINDVRYFRPGLHIDPIHDNTHVLPDLVTARESTPYMINLPEHGIAALTYTWVNKNREAGAVMAIFGPGVGDQPIQQLLPDRKVPDSMDYSDWRIDKFRMQQDLKFQHADIAWETDAATLEFSFDAIHPPYAYSMHPDGCPSYAAGDRIEQSGRTTGRIVLPNKEVRFESFTHRDHSWGTRDWRPMLHYNWFHGQSNDGKVAIHYWRCLALGKEVIRGYVVKDGVMADVVRVESDITFDANYFHQKLVTTLHDEAGRATHIVADFYAHYIIQPAPEWQLREAAASATYDGQPGLAWTEVGWQTDYVNYISKNGPF